VLESVRTVTRGTSGSTEALGRWSTKAAMAAIAATPQPTAITERRKEGVGRRRFRAKIRLIGEYCVRVYILVP
jgi:hypothetical protein